MKPVINKIKINFDDYGVYFQRSYVLNGYTFEFGNYEGFTEKAITINLDIDEYVYHFDASFKGKYSSLSELQVITNMKVYTASKNGLTVTESKIAESEDFSSTKRVLALGGDSKDFSTLFYYYIE